MDRDAESHYDDTETDKPWEQHKGPIAIDGHPITSNAKQALERNVRTRISMEFLSKRCAQAGDAAELDTHIMNSVRSAETQAGMLTKSPRITHSGPLTSTLQELANGTPTSALSAARTRRRTHT